MMLKLSPFRAKLAGLFAILIVSTGAVVGTQYGSVKWQRMSVSQQRQPAARDSLSRILRGNPKHTSKRRAKGCVSTSGRCEVDVSVEVRNVTNDVGVNAPPPADRQIAVIRNNGAFTEATYELKPFYEAEYLLRIIGGKPGTEARWVLTEVLANGTASTHKSGRISQCARYSPREASDVNFYTCTLTDHSPNKPPHPARSNMFRASMLAPFDRILGLFKSEGHLAQQPDSPIWIACNNGCCTLM